MLYSRSTKNSKTAHLMVINFIIATLSIQVYSYSSDILYIRHGRSRVRHSNEKDHVQWGLQAFDNLTLDYDSYDNDTFSSGSGSGSNGGQLFGSEFWFNSDNNGTLINQTGIILKQDIAISTENETVNNQALSTILPQATTAQPLRKKKIHKKLIMESIRKNVDKGLEYLKLHKNLIQNSNKAISQEFSEDSKQQIFNKNDAVQSKSETSTTPSGEVISKFSSERLLLLNPTHKLPTEENNRMRTTVVSTDKYNTFLHITETNLIKNASPTNALIATSNFQTDKYSETDYELNDDTLIASQIKSIDGLSNTYTSTGKEDGKHDMQQELNSSDVFLEEIKLDTTFPDDSDVENVHSSINSYGVVDGEGANEDELYDWDEISRNNRRNLMRGRDVVTKFLQIVETQHSLGSNCEAGTSLNLGEGVVDRYAQDRFRVEAEVAVNRANMLTRIFKMTTLSVQSSVNLLHASVLSMVEFDDDIFAAGNCFDWNQHPSQPGLFCPFAYRLPSPNQGALFAKDLATEYHYLGNTSEWFFLARKNAEKVIARNDQYIRAFHLYSNKTEERIEEETLFVRYEDGRWSKPYYDCGGGNIWMLTYTVPFFGYENGTYFFKGTSGIDIDLRRVDIDQCPQRKTPGVAQPLNIFAGTDKCKQRTTMCEAIKGLGFRRGSYKCVCRKGYYFPDTSSAHKYFNGSILEEEYEKLMLGKNSTYSIAKEYECLPCAEGCDSCEDGSPCIAALNWPMRTSILLLACAIIGLLPPAAWFTFRYQQVKVVRTASPAILRVIALGAFFIYCTTIVMYPNPSLYTCTARIWLREIGFSLTYGALMLKTWRISVIFRVRSAKALKITDAVLLKRLGIICAVIGTCLLVRTLVSPPDVIVSRTADDLKAFLCRTDWWDYTFTSMEVLFLAWGVGLCIVVRRAPTEFNESRFISMAIYNEFLLTCFLNVSMFFLQSPANPDLLYIIFFCHTQLTVTLLLVLTFGSKVYIALRSGKPRQEDNETESKPQDAKPTQRRRLHQFAITSSATTSTAQLETKLSDQEALEEVRTLSIHLQRIQEMAPPKGIAVMTISHLLENLKPKTSCQLQTTSTKTQQHTMMSHIPMLSTNSDIQKFQQNTDFSGSVSVTTTNNSPTSTKPLLEKSINTSITGEDFVRELIVKNTSIKCEHCSQNQNGTRTISCQQLGSPKPEGSISFSNIKLECMCSQPDDLDRIYKPDKKDIFKECMIVKTVSTSTNTTPTYRCGKRGSKPKLNTSKFYNSPNTGIKHQTSIKKTIVKNEHNYKSTIMNCDKHKGGEHFLICDGCRDRLSNSLKKISSEPTNCRMVTHRSNELLDRSMYERFSEVTDSFSYPTRTIENCSTITTSLGDLDVIQNNKLYSTDDECGEKKNDGLTSMIAIKADAASNSSSACILPDNINSKNKYKLDDYGSQSNLSSASNEIKQNTDPARVQRRPDKLLLDLNDRSKYTKEVSV